jgi:hypothetical protein
MRRRSTVAFAELRRFLNGLGFKDKRTERAWPFAK